MRAYRKHPHETIEGLINRPVNNNLLINSDFVNPVNQRNITTLNGGDGYTVDRWYFASWVVSGSDNTNGAFTWNNNGYANLWTRKGGVAKLEQYLEFPNLYRNKTLTASIKYRTTPNSDCFIQLGCQDINGKWGIKTHALPPNIEWSVATLTVDLLQLTANMAELKKVKLTTACAIYDDENIQWHNVNNESSMDIEWIDLEYGNVATPHYPRLYAEEWQLCQRYYQVVRGFYNPNGYYEDTQLRTVVNFPLMRRVPTVTYFDQNVTNGTSVLKYAKDTGATHTGFTFSNVSVGERHVSIRAVKTNHGLTPTTAMFSVHLGLDAEL